MQKETQTEWCSRIEVAHNDHENEGAKVLSIQEDEMEEESHRTEYHYKRTFHHPAAHACSASIQ
jgi:hypothetical protein